jgi:ABC-type phosphate transport system substrate-binding protein
MRILKFFSLATLILLSVSYASAMEMVVFVSENSPIKNLSTDEVSDIFLGKKRYVESGLLTPVVYVEGIDSRAAFLREVLNVSHSAYRFHWMKRIFREGGRPPVEVISEAAAFEFVRSTSGGIGYAYAQSFEKVLGTREVLRFKLK